MLKKVRTDGTIDNYKIMLVGKCYTQKEVKSSKSSLYIRNEKVAEKQRHLQHKNFLSFCYLVPLFIRCSRRRSGGDCFSGKIRQVVQRWRRWQSGAATALRKGGRALDDGSSGSRVVAGWPWRSEACARACSAPKWRRQCEGKEIRGGACGVVDNLVHGTA
jgi:hypothetical protein